MRNGKWDLRNGIGDFSTRRHEEKCKKPIVGPNVVKQIEDEMPKVPNQKWRTSLVVAIVIVVIILSIPFCWVSASLKSTGSSPIRGSHQSVGGSLMLDVSSTKRGNYNDFSRDYFAYYTCSEAEYVSKQYYKYRSALCLTVLYQGQVVQNKSIVGRYYDSSSPSQAELACMDHLAAIYFSSNGRPPAASVKPLSH